VTTTRIDGLQLRRPLVDGGPTSPVSWIVTDVGITHLAGEPASVFDIPWHQIGGFTVSADGSVVSAMVAGERLEWTVPTSARKSVRAVVVQRGGRVAGHRILAGVALGSAIVVGALVSYLAITPTSEVTTSSWLGITNYALSARDVPANFAPSTNSVLSVLVPGTTVEHPSSTTTTTPNPHSAINQQFDHMTSTFYACEGLTAATDRYYGKAGQFPDFQVGSRVYASTSGHAQEVGSLAQWYATTAMVAKDRAQMARPAFIGCATQSVATQLGIVLTQSTGTFTVGDAQSVNIVTPGHVFHRAAVSTVTITSGGNQVTLWVSLIVAVDGHIETDSFVEGQGPVDTGLIKSIGSAIVGKILSSGGATASA